MKILLREASVYCGHGFAHQDIAVEGGRILDIKESIPSSGFDAVFHLKDMVVLPGFADWNSSCCPGRIYGSMCNAESESASG